MVERNTVVVTSKGALRQLTSVEMLVASSGLMPAIGAITDRPVAFVSSVNGDGAKCPRPPETRAVQPPPGRTSTDSRGLKKVPKALWRSTRALAAAVSQRETA